MRIDSPQKRKKSEIMRQLCIERKSQNFQSLKKWDMSRASKLIIHRKIVDEMDQSLETKISQSTDYIRIVRQFFTDLLNQKNRYVSHIIQNPEQKMKINPFSRNVYPTPSRTLTKMYESQSHLKQAQKVKKVLEESLQRINQFLLQGIDKFYLSRGEIIYVTENKTLIVSFVNAGLQYVNSSQMRLIGRTVQLNQISQTTNVPRRFFHDTTTIFIVGKKTITLSTTVWCTNSLVLVNSCRKITDKSSTYQRNHRYFLNQIFQGNYVSSLKNQSAPQYLSSLNDILSKNTQSKYVEEYFSPQQLLTRQLISQLAQVQSKHETQITVKYLKIFLKKFQYEEFDNRNLVLKAIKVFVRSNIDNSTTASQNQLQQKLSSNQLKQQKTFLQPIEIYVTVDGFINIYKISLPSSNSSLDQRQTQNESQNDNQEKSFLYSLKISQSLSFNRIADLQLNLNLKKWGLISFSEPHEEQITIVFHSEDQREEFLEFIVRLK